MRGADSLSGIVIFLARNHHKNRNPKSTKAMARKNIQQTNFEDPSGPENKMTTDRDGLVQDIDEAIARFSTGTASAVTSSIEEDKSKENGDEHSIIQRYEPKLLQSQFQQLFSVLSPCLCREEDTMTAAAILMGPRGSGKSLLLDRCFAACRHLHPSKKFRKVVINGILSRGEDVPSVVYEIIRQLSDIAFDETPSWEGDDDEYGDNDGSSTVSAEASNRRKRRKIQSRHMLRQRKSTFTSNLALLESTLKIAEVDQIPIIIILDELDSFTDEGERQIILYHLLDRVATPGSNLCLIGMTSSFTTLTMLEKRIRSRAEGTSKVIYVAPLSSHQDLIKVIEHNLDGLRFSDQILSILNPPDTSQPTTSTTSTSTNDESNSRIRSCIERECRFGKDMRWYSRIFTCALSLYRLDVMMTSESHELQLPTFSSRYLSDALVMCGANISDDSQQSATQQSNFNLWEKQAIDPRLQAILDLSPPQVAILLSARRILSREAHREDVVIPLTLRRIFQEYESFRKGTKKESLLPAALQLLERGVLLPSMDHSGGGPLQYNFSELYKTLDSYSLRSLPLHLPYEIDHELGEALKNRQLNCSTALSEWGRKVN